MNCFENDIFRPVSLNNSYDILLFTCIVIATNTVQVLCTFVTFLLTSSSLISLFHLISSKVLSISVLFIALHDQ